MTHPAGASFPLAGQCDSRFAAVRDAFATNFEVDGDVGASVAVVLDGKLVVDLWGGHIDKERTQPWGRDTIVVQMSVAKGFNAIVMQKLFDLGLLEIDAPVARCWPEFAGDGKDAITLRDVLTHRSGLEVVDDPMWPGAVYDWNAFVGALEKQAPSHPPGTFPAYHAITLGFLTGELVRRVTGKSYGRVLRELVTGPLGLDYQVGLSRPDLTRCARFIPGQPFADPDYLPPQQTPLASKTRTQFDPANDDDSNSAQYRMSEIPSANGHGNARSVAGFYGSLALDDGKVVSQEALQRITEVQWSGPDAILTHNIHMGLGVRLNSPDVYMGPNAAAWGHSGAGGSLGFVDPEARLGFSYAMNVARPTRNNGPRTRRLIEALYSCL
jgi:CubicO group peptidase (beta-lactamase class C family)